MGLSLLILVLPSQLSLPFWCTGFKYPKKIKLVVSFFSVQCEGNHEWWQSFTRMPSKEVPARWTLENVDPGRVWCQISTPCNLHIFSPLWIPSGGISIVHHALPAPPPKCQVGGEKNIRRVEYSNIRLVGEEADPMIFFISVILVCPACAEEEESAEVWGPCVANRITHRYGSGRRVHTHCIFSMVLITLRKPGLLNWSGGGRKVVWFCYRTVLLLKNFG